MKTMLTKIKPGKKSFLIFTVCYYLNIDGIIINENVTTTLEANRSKKAALSCVFFPTSERNIS